MRRQLLVCVVAVGFLAMTACEPAPPEPVVSDAFTVIFIGDTEPRMRGNTDAEVAGAVQNLVKLKTSRVRYFDAGGGTQYRINPKLVILGGDISADRTTSIAADMALYEPLYDARIAFIAGFGNHDWESPWNADAYSPAGQAANDATTAFTRETYRRSTSKGLTYQEIGPTASHGPTTFHATFRGVDIVNFNTYLYEPSYDYPASSPQGCPSGTASSCPIFVSAEPQISAMETVVTQNPQRPMLVVQHYPVNSYEPFWRDYGASGTNVGQRRGRLLQLAASRPRVGLLSAHQHGFERDIHGVNGRYIGETVAPYFGGANGNDPSKAGGAVAILISPTKGILEVKQLPPG